MLTGAALMLLACAPAVEPGTGVGQAPLARMVPTVQGGEATLPLPDRAHAVLFWTSWCGSCPATARDLADQGLDIVTVNAGEHPLLYGRGPAGAAVELADPAGALRRAWQIDAVPAVVVFDAHGVVTHRGSRAPTAAPAG